jgi:capsular polysaccharide export protein
VNGNSSLPRDPQHYLEAVAPRVAEPRNYRWVFTRRVFSCIAYYLMMALERRRYARYDHYRSDNLVREACAWVRAGWRRKLYALRERRTLRQVKDRGFYLVPLQVEGDTQLTYHSDYTSVPDFIAHVIASFAAHAPGATELVIKHHPMDRGYNDYAWLIRDLARQHGVAGRVRYIHDVSLPALLRKARGVVVINSTVGLSALHHGTPTITLGDAIYDLPGLTYQGDLDGFWARPGKVDSKLFRKYRAYLVHYTQLNGTSATTDADWTLLDRLPGFSPSVAPPVVAAVPAAHAVGENDDDLPEENRTASGRLIIATDEFRRQPARAAEKTGVPSA